MRHVRIPVFLFALLLVATVVSLPLPAQTLNGTAFTYQGRLTDGGPAADGVYDFRFILYAADLGTSQVGPTVNQDDRTVSGGLFATTLDFGNVFDGNQRYLEIGVRPGASTGAYTILGPRQLLAPAPYAHYSAKSGTATLAETATIALSAQSASTATTLSLPFSGSGSAGGSATLFSVTNTGTGYAGKFTGGGSNPAFFVENTSTGPGIRAQTSSSGTLSAILGYNNGTDRYGGEFELLNATNPRAAIYARTAGTGQGIDAEVNSNTTADAIFARTTSPTAGSYAGVFSGPVQISCSAATCNTANALQVVGNFAATVKNFKIDHPLDPANKYLNHTSVESPDMKNIYDGVIVTDSQGLATVQLPNYFEALNRDFRYQLTVMGTFAQAIVKDEIAANRFTIQTDKPGVKVSWQVTGSRADAYARAYPIPVEEEKPAKERGRYLSPELFGRTAGESISAIEDREGMPRIEPKP